MTNLNKQAHEQLEEIIKTALGRCITAGTLPAVALPAFTIQQPSDTTHGDFACNVALISAKAFSLSPRAIADLIMQNLSFVGSYFTRCEVAGPGFLNFFLAQDWFAAVLNGVLSDGEQYGRSDFGQGEKVLVEFVSANPTGPMHIGNARGGALGDGLASVLEWAGYNVEREFYVNDAGNQIAKFGLSLGLRYLSQYDDSIEMPEDAYLGQDIIDHVKEFTKLHGDAYCHVSKQERESALVEFALPKNIQSLKEHLAVYRIHYDNWYFESKLHETGAVERIIEQLKQTGHTYSQDGALWLRAEQFGADKDFVLVRANKIPTYITPDIAYHFDKLVTRNFSRAINVLGSDHHGYVDRLKAALSALGIDAGRLQAVLMQMVRLVKEGEVIKASKRSGKAITLLTLLEEVPVDAARLIFNMREANTQMDFDLDLAVEQSSENPVYYLQYAHARICSILSRIESTQPSTSGAFYDASLLTQPEERALIFQLAKLPSEIIEASKHNDPSKVGKYGMQLAALFHKFYGSCQVSSENQALTEARKSLCIAVKTALHNVLSLLRITAPERM